MTHRKPTGAQLAELYQVDRKQIARWRSRGIDVLRPAEVLRHLAEQPRTGTTFDRLLRPGLIQGTECAIQCVILGKEIPPALTKIITT